jgi:hypothetical protein
MKRETFRQGKSIPTPAGSGERRESIATRLIGIGRRSGLFHNADTAYATVQVGGHLETLAIRSRMFKSYLAREFFESEAEHAASAEALSTATLTLEALAFQRGETRSVFVRLGKQDGKTYLDLGDPAWRTVEITSEGWRILASEQSPIRFRRPPGMLPLPEPECGSSIEDLRPFLNTSTEKAFVLLVGWLIMAYHPSGPYPVLVLGGEQGAAKTTTAQFLRALIDPHEAGLRKDIRELRDLAICARNCWVVGLDNLSHIQQWLSDAICCLSTGSAFGTRLLYSDDEEKLFAARRSVLLNGITEFVVSGDLVDRSIIVKLPAIQDDQRREEEDFSGEFKNAQPRLLGAVLDAVSCALRNRDQVKLRKLPRMADFARWVAGAEEKLGWKAGTFLEAYAENRADVNDLPLQGHLVERLYKIKLPFEGTATELLRELEADAGERILKARDWPASPDALSNTLRRLAPNLRRAGTLIDFFRDRGKKRRRLISIELVEEDGSKVSEVSEALK